MTPQIQARISPRVNVVGEGDGLVAPGRSLRPPNAPVLIESCSAINGRRVDSLGQIDVVRTAITVNAAYRRSSGRSKSAPAINDVIFYKRASRPPIESQISIAGRLPDAGIVAYYPG